MESMVMNFNLDPDLEERLAKEIDPTGPIFRALPLEEQVRRVDPILREQKRRDRARLRKFLVPAMRAA